MIYQKHHLKSSVINKEFIKISLFASDEEEDFSYGLDPKFILNATTAKVEGSIITSLIKIMIDNDSGKISIKDHRNETILRFDTPKEIIYKEKRFLFTPISLLNNKAIFGLGDQPVEPNLRGKSFELWGTDTYAYGYGSNPLYKNIPFFILSNSEISIGIFLDSTYRTYFNFEDVEAGFGTNGKSKTYYLFAGNSATEVVEKYHQLTGTPALPPLWALGYHQCKWSYFPEKKVKSIANKFRKLQIPCDAIYLDIDYMDGFRCFTWNEDHFPSPFKLIKWLKTRGFKTVVMIDPGIKKDKRYKIWKSGIEADVFCKMPDGSIYDGNVWPGKCNFPDFTDPKSREWWEEINKEFVLEYDLDGIWNDMNEPAIYDPVRKVQTQRTFPDEVQHCFDGQPTDHSKAHNIYGMQMSRATNEAQQKAYPEKRPLTITRSTYSGGQRYAAVWTGDNIATWEHLKIANWQVLSLAISGFSFAGSDIGGFVGDPDGELYIRWLQLAVFHPFFRTHSSKGFKDQEPWSYGKEFTDISRNTIQLRYRLMPYIYTVFFRYSNDKKPMLKPLFFDYPQDHNTINNKEDFIFGDHLLVAPITDKGSRGKWVYLPTGIWYKNRSNEPLVGGKTFFTSANIDEIPFFVKGGAIIPWSISMQYTGEIKSETQELHCYIGNENTKSYLYLDNGENQEYKKGKFRLFTFTFSLVENTYFIDINSIGNEPSIITTFSFRIYGITAPISIISDNIKIEHECGEFISFKTGVDINKIEIKKI